MQGRSQAQIIPLLLSLGFATPRRLQQDREDEGPAALLPGPCTVLFGTEL